MCQPCWHQEMKRVRRVRSHRLCENKTRKLLPLLYWCRKPLTRFKYCNHWIFVRHITVYRLRRVRRTFPRAGSQCYRCFLRNEFTSRSFSLRTTSTGLLSAELRIIRFLKTEWALHIVSTLVAIAAKVATVKRPVNFKCNFFTQLMRPNYVGWRVKKCPFIARV